MPFQGCYNGAMKCLHAFTRLMLLAASASLLAVTAQSSKAPVHVSSCQAHRNETTMYGGGWGPAYYPAGGRYYWPSVYGYNYYQPPVTTSDPTLNIDYVNRGTQSMKEIEFGLVINGNLVAEVKDVGTFSPGAEIKHRFGVSGSIFPITGLPHCVPLKISYADGTTWKSPHLPALKHRLGE